MYSTILWFYQHFSLLAAMAGSACNKPTNGVFNKAHKLIRHLDRKKAQGVDLNDLAARQGGDSSSSSSSSSS